VNIPALQAESQTVILAADSWYPFNGNPKSELPGYIVEVAQKILEKKNFKVEYKVMPWARAIAEMMAGRINGIIGATHEEVENAIFPIECLGLASNAFFIRSDSSWQFKDESSLTTVVLGGITDYSYGSLIQAYIKKNQNNSKLIQLSSGESALEQNIKKLLMKRIDALVETPEVFWSQIKAMGLSNDSFSNAGSTGEKEPLYIAFSPKKENSKQLAELLSAGILELRRSGELKEILARYGIEDWK
jgi:polar amino acid transport system substrate-binding protein